ncbi:MAG: hypothetical protein HY289_15315 [Planctomycetes bacterium]|nr:hypothetical protein [Planctomycetota bacterium]
MTETLFLSTVTKEFGPFRARLARFLQRTKKVHVRHQDDFFHHGVPTLHMLEEEIIKSTFVVHIIGAEPGWAPPIDQVEGFLKRHDTFEKKYPDIAKVARTGVISATQWEAWLALFFGKRLYAYESPKRLLDGSPQKLHSDRLHQPHQHPKAIDDEDPLFDEVIGSLFERGLLTQAEIERKIAPSRILKHAPDKLFGREKWLDALDEAWRDDKVNVYTLIAWGGVGKTALVAHWVATRFHTQKWPGVERYFDWSFYSQGTGDSRQTSSDVFIQDALKFFDDPDPIKGSPWERGQRLAGLIQKHRTLLVLDGIEPLQYPPNDPQAGRLKDQALEALIQGLAADNPGLCIITSREHLTNIESLPAVRENKLDKLFQEAAVALLRHLQLVGSEEEMIKAWDAAGGHALTLRLLGRLIARAYGRDIRRWREVKFEEADKLAQGRSAVKVMRKTEEWLRSAETAQHLELAALRLTGLFDRPMSPDSFRALCAAPVIAGLTEMLVSASAPELEAALDTLVANDLLTHGGIEVAGSTVRHSDLPIDAHPLIREYFAKQLREKEPAAFKEAHSRLFDHLCKTTKPHRPDGIDGLQPLYQAVLHGCLAGRQQEAFDEVYVERIVRGTDQAVGFYSIKKLGAFGADLAAVAAFFDAPWRRVSPNLTESDQAWLLNAAGSFLRALGRLTEALQPMRSGLDMRVQQQSWKGAAIIAGNLSELEVNLGRLTDAVTDGRQAIIYADQSGDSLEKLKVLTKAADALTESGKRDEAGPLFSKAEGMWAKAFPRFPGMGSTFGYRYCDWLLNPPERIAWQIVSICALGTTNKPSPDADLEHVCNEVERRANSSLEWASDLLSTCLDRLTLARIGLIRVITTNPLPQPAFDLPHVAAAVNGFRNAGQMDQLPKGLLTAALYHFVRGEHAAARANLNEALQIAERGPMPLYLADVALHRARMFRDKTELAKAAKLIRDLGYGRRDGELTDAEEAARSW